METARTIARPGCNLSYRLSGDGPPVVLIQGAGVHGAGWEPQLTDLNPRYRCITFDNRGVGLSQPNTTPLTIPQMADDADALMDAEGLDSAHVIGHSMGGHIALDLALRHRARVRSLSLLCTFADGRVPVRLSGRMIWIGIRTRIGTKRQRRAAMVEMVMPKSVLANCDHQELARTLGDLFGHDLADQSPVVMKQLSAMRAYDVTPRLSEFAGIPTLVVSATEDLIAPVWAGRKLAQGIPGTRFIELPNAAHAVPIHSPEVINQLLLYHLNAQCLS